MEREGRKERKRRSTRCSLLLSLVPLRCFFYVFYAIDDTCFFFLLPRMLTIRAFIRIRSICTRVTRGTLERLVCKEEGMMKGEVRCREQKSRGPGQEGETHGPVNGRATDPPRVTAE